MTTSIQTCGSRDSLTDEFTLSMCFGNNPALSFEGLTREQIVNLRDCLDCMLWDEVDNEYGETLDAVTATLEPYVPGEAVDEAAAEVLSMIRDLLLRKVEFNDDNLDGVLHWPNVESMMTRPLDY
jgi:hypothetical protein